MLFQRDSDYRQLQEEGRENPTIYKDLVTGKDYFYDAFSKTLTGIKYPETRELSEVTNNLENQPSVSAPTYAPESTDLKDIDMEKLLGLDELEKVPVESPSVSVVSPSVSNDIENVKILPEISMPEENSNIAKNNIINLKNNNIQDEKNNNQNNNSLIFGLDLNNLLGYILILLIILAVLYVTVQMIQN